MVVMYGETIKFKIVHLYKLNLDTHYYVFDVFIFYKYYLIYLIYPKTIHNYNIRCPNILYFM